MERREYGHAQYFVEELKDERTQLESIAADYLKYSKSPEQFIDLFSNQLGNFVFIFNNVSVDGVRDRYRERLKVSKEYLQHDRRNPKLVSHGVKFSPNFLTIAVANQAMLDIEGAIQQELIDNTDVSDIPYYDVTDNIPVVDRRYSSRTYQVSRSPVTDSTKVDEILEMADWHYIEPHGEVEEVVFTSGLDNLGGWYDHIEKTIAINMHENGSATVDLLIDTMTFAHEATHSYDVDQPLVLSSEIRARLKAVEVAGEVGLSHADPITRKLAERSFEDIFEFEGTRRRLVAQQMQYIKRYTGQFTMLPEGLLKLDHNIGYQRRRTKKMMDEATGVNLSQQTISRVI
jgi:hypothetical protein